MAERRMFAKTIIDSDAFIDMPLSTQALYFHLAMRADDDGFINNPRKIQRMIGSSEDDLKLLLTKRYILAFDSGVIVIKHWRMHNYVQKDRYKPTVYVEEKSTLQIKKNGSYTECIQNVSSLDTQVRLGKDSIGKVSLGKDCSDFTLENVKKYVEERGNKIDPEKFFNYYGDGVEDWKAKVEEWERTQFKRPTKQSTHKDPYATYDIEAFEKMLIEKAYG